MFLTFEANEGAGKSTQAKLLAQALRDEGYDVVHTREPGGTPLAEKIRKLVVEGEPDSMDAHTEFLLFTAARRHHVQTLILPALKAGKIVISDRYLGSTRALQGKGAGIADDFIMKTHQDFVGLMPDATLFLDMDAKTAVSRALARTGQAEQETRFEKKADGFHDRVEASFKEQSQDPSWITINANKSIEEIHEEILKKVKNLIEMKKRENLYPWIAQFET